MPEKARVKMVIMGVMAVTVDWAVPEVMVSGAVAGGAEIGTQD